MSAREGAESDAVQGGGALAEIEVIAEQPELMSQL